MMREMKSDLRLFQMLWSVDNSPMPLSLTIDPFTAMMSLTINPFAAMMSLENDQQQCEI